MCVCEQVHTVCTTDEQIWVCGNRLKLCLCNLEVYVERAEYSLLLLKVDEVTINSLLFIIPALGVCTYLQLSLANCTNE